MSKTFLRVLIDLSLTGWRDFFKTWRRQTDLDRAKDASPGRSSVCFRPAATGLIHREKRRKAKTMYQLITFQTTALCSRNSKNRSPWLRALFLIPFALALAWFAVAPQARAFCRDGCLGNFNTVLGDDALTLATGGSNTAMGYRALYSNTTGGANTANGVSALQEITTGFDNTATGASALASNTTGFENTASGLQALFYNTNGNYNTADGVNALFNNTTGGNNTANGAYALYYNTTG